MLFIITPIGQKQSFQSTVFLRRNIVADAMPIDRRVIPTLIRERMVRSRGKISEDQNAGRLHASIRQDKCHVDRIKQITASDFRPRSSTPAMYLSIRNLAVGSSSAPTLRVLR